MSELCLIVGMALITFFIRYGLLGMSSRIKLSASVTQMLRYIPPAVLTAIVVPAVLITSTGELMLSYTNARLMGAIAAILISFWTKNLLLTIVLGMLVFLCWQWLVQLH
ncbi:AzlD domain-containing protein [Scytonema tolypothrichoides VB-61278]|nr:AzlD domain-containing protein [Scytonema tolypothrichoides VB-61278]